MYQFSNGYLYFAYEYTDRVHIDPYRYGCRSPMGALIDVLGDDNFEIKALNPDSFDDDTLLTMVVFANKRLFIRICSLIATKDNKREKEH